MSRATCFKSGMPVLLFAVMVLRGNALALEGSPPVAPEDVLDAGELDTLRSEAATNEDPDSARRAERQAITKAQS